MEYKTKLQVTTLHLSVLSVPIMLSGFSFFGNVSLLIHIRHWIEVITATL